MTESAREPSQLGPPALRDSLQAMAEHLEAGLLERDVAARLLLLAAVASEHALLIGPPGTAKSELARRLQEVIAPPPGAPEQAFFERLLTRFSTPEELFGPLSLKALESDRYERLTGGYLPTARVAFLDEVFKANSAILNALLTLLNERAFDNGTQRLAAPLVTVVGASNESPSDEALQAFQDRFLIRVPIEPVSDASFDALLEQGQPRQPMPRCRLTEDDRQAIETSAAAVTLGADAAGLLLELRLLLRQRDQRVSDRRWRQLARLLRLAAAAEGSPEVGPADLWIAAFVLAGEPQGCADLLHWWQHQALKSGDSEPSGWPQAVEAFERQLEVESLAQAEQGAQSAGKMALARSLGASPGQGESTEMLRLYSERVEESLRKRWSPRHVRARVAQVRALRDSIGVSRDHQAQILERIRQQTQGRLWLAPSLARKVQQPLQERLAMLDGLRFRLEAVELGFANLPVDESLTDLPEPLSLHPADSAKAQVP